MSDHDPYAGDPYGDDPFAAEPVPDLRAALSTLNQLGRYDSDELAALLADQMRGGGDVAYILREVAEAQPGWLADLAKSDKDLMVEAAVFDHEFQRERRRRAIRHELDAADRAAEVSGEAEGRMVDGADFILNVPEQTPAVWGEGNAVAWAEGEALLLTGTPGVGKTTLAGQLVRARLVGGSVLGMPVAATSTRVLYLAMDRPQQIRCSMARVLRDLPREDLSKLQVWQGPPLDDVAANPKVLLELARKAGADTIVIDSLKDAAIGLSADDVGAAYNRARQFLTAAGVEVMELHHIESPRVWWRLSTDRG